MTFLPDKPVAVWCAALHSGQYAQGSGRLRRDDEFCCLGVACDIVPGIRWVSTYGAPETKNEVLEAASAPPYEIQELFGLTWEMVDTLVDANDARLYPFSDIAVLISELVGVEGLHPPTI